MGYEFPFELELLAPPAEKNKTFSSDGWNKFEVEVLNMIREFVKTSIDKGITPKKLLLKGSVFIK